MTLAAIHARLTVRGLLRRRLPVAVLVLLPVALYLASHDTVGRSVRALVFGISWAVSTVALFSTLAARELEPGLWLAGHRRRELTAGRTAGLLALALVLSAGFWAMVALDQPVRSIGAVALDFAVTAVVAVAFGSAVGALVKAELEGALVLFLFAGLQAVANPFDGWTRALPFWSSRELGTWAVDGPAQGSLAGGSLHAVATVVVCLAATVLGTWGRRRLPSGP